jgi:H+-transporting ATPase
MATNMQAYGSAARLEPATSIQVDAPTSDLRSSKKAGRSLQAGAKSDSQKAVLQIGDFLVLLAAALAVVLVAVQVYRQMVVPGHWSWDVAGQIVQFILVLLVASVPVALPAVVLHFRSRRPSFRACRRSTSWRASTFYAATRTERSPE